jgi:hypothetical protein
MLQRRNGARERRRGEERSTDNRLLHRKDAALTEEWIGSATAVGCTVDHRDEAVAATTRFDAFERDLGLQGVNAARRVCPIA